MNDVLIDNSIEFQRGRRTESEKQEAKNKKIRDQKAKLQSGRLIFFTDYTIF